MSYVGTASGQKADASNEQRILASSHSHPGDSVGHFLMMEKPKQFNEAVIAFLDKNALLQK